MDGSIVDHSDSDSGESWTLLDNLPASDDGAPEIAEEPQALPERHIPDAILERDEDTDGISIISDSDPESAPCDLNYERRLLEESRPAENEVPEILAEPLTRNNNAPKQSIRSESEILVDNTTKLKTYVHRRNKRLSTVLNIIMLGSVITAAGVALGHMWGARNDCSLNATPSVNKILSNLYKLQEENAYLRNKLKEMTASNLQLMQQWKSGTEKQTLKQQRCKKMYEEPLSNKNSERVVKCVDSDSNVVQKNEENAVPAYEKGFLADLDKLKHTYQQNKSWLDYEVSRRMKLEQEISKNKDAIVEVDEEQIDPKDNARHRRANAEIKWTLDAQNSGPDDNVKISYADSLKADIRKLRGRPFYNANKGNREPKEYRPKQKVKRQSAPAPAASEEDIPKDDRYTFPRVKPEKKHDRQKPHKKQKRRNKYEQWEMKGGYLKDYDAVSASSRESSGPSPRRSQDRYVELLAGGAARPDWQERPEPAAGWYFRRGRRREQCRAQPREHCRAQPDNTTFKQLLRRNMNFKIKH